MFLGIGLAGVNALRAEGEEQGRRPRCGRFHRRAAPGRATCPVLPVGRDVVVIGGGMTAVDAAVQSKLLGAENVTIVYRRGQEKMSASGYEQDHATSGGRADHPQRGARCGFWAMARPRRWSSPIPPNGPDGLTLTAETFTLKADQVFKAIGQTLEGAPEGLTRGGRQDCRGRAGQRCPGLGGGDCAAGGEDLTVTAVAEGRDAAEDIHAALMGRA